MSAFVPIGRKSGWCGHPSTIEGRSDKNMVASKAVKFERPMVSMFVFNCYVCCVSCIFGGDGWLHDPRIMLGFAFQMVLVVLFQTDVFVDVNVYVGYSRAM